MNVSTLLLDSNDIYVDDNGNNPWGFENTYNLRTELYRDQVVSELAYSILPSGIKDLVEVTEEIEPTAGITISEIDGLADLLIVYRTDIECVGGKKFRFDNFNPVVIDENIEIWRRK